MVNALIYDKVHNPIAGYGIFPHSPGRVTALCSSATMNTIFSMNRPCTTRSIRIMIMRQLLRSVLLILACGSAVAFAASPERIFTVRGIVRGPLTNGTIRIAHQAIPDYMPAMTMPFNVAPDSLRAAEQLRVGDGVEFTFAVGESSRAFDFKRIGPETPSDQAEGPRLPPSIRLKEGAPIPAFTLRDQFDRPLTAADLHGKRTILTFIFTRCPVPEFCPLMSRRFQELQERLLASPPAGAPVQLLSITIDPQFDTPQILRAYGESYGADPNRWRFATGTKEQVTALTRAFAVHTDQSRGVLDHTLATALIGADGRVQTIWRGNGWKVDEVLAALAGSDPGAGTSMQSEPPAAR